MGIYQRKEGKPMATMMYAAYLTLTGRFVSIIYENYEKRLSINEAKRLLNLIRN